MASILIAYNNDTFVKLHDFMESCGDMILQYCYDNHIKYTPLTPPHLVENNIMTHMENHHLCFIAGHGDDDGIYNEADEDVISMRTTNYNFQGKALYCVSCSCATNLCPNLMQIGLKLFVGYNDTFEVRGDYLPFVQSALSGLKCLLNGDDAKTAKEEMNKIFDEQIDILNQENPWAAISLLHDKEALVFQGDENYRLNY